jgi:GntR family transcriptional regulator/MocR family aminotransferase
MPRRPSHSTFRAFDLSPAASEPLHRQLYEELRRAILSGRLAPGCRLPASRELASVSKVSRNTVLSAYEQLLAEGYIQSRAGSGTFVAEAIPETLVPERASSESLGPAAPDRGVSERGRVVATTRFTVHPVPQTANAFRIGLPALDHFPMDTWRRLMDRRLRRASVRMLAYGDPAGYMPLREAVAAHLAASRGVRCDAANVVMVAGSQHGIWLCGHLLADPGDPVWMEDPGYFAARHALSALRLRPVPVPVDADGLVVSEGAQRAPGARLVYCTPSHQNPTGATMSLARRMQLLQWAHGSGAWILEDDNASEYRYRGRPLAALQGIDNGGRVLYLGTFSKVMFSSMRLGYLVLPDELVEPFARGMQFMTRGLNGTQQAVLADFMAEGHFARHLRRMRTLYASRLARLETALHRQAAGLLETQPMEGGLNLLVWLPPGVSDLAVSEEAGRQGLLVAPLSESSVAPLARQGLLLGFAGVPEAEIDSGVERLAAAVRTVQARPGGGA